MSPRDGSRELRQNIVAPKSKIIYRNSAIQFPIWLLNNQRRILTTDCIALADGSSNKRKFVKLFFNQAPENPPVTFDEMDATVFMLWITSLRKKDGSRPSNATCKLHQAGLFNLFRNYKKTMRRDMETELAAYYLALKRAAATRIASGVGKVKFNKDPGSS